MLASTSSGFFLNRFSIQRTVGSMGRVNSQEVSPSAQKFLHRLATLVLRFSPSTARKVILVISSGKTWYFTREPSSRGLVA